MDIKPWIEAARLRTLPLALSSIITGSACAVYYGSFKWYIAILAALTTIFLQVLSNYANDYGDAVSGKDNEGRIGPQRAVASGEISKESMKKAVIIFSVLSLISGVSLSVIAFQSGIFVLFFSLLGLAAIAAAIKYTVGKNPYGYNGLGDLFVFIFFGIVGVFGSFFLFGQQLEWQVLLPAICIGLLSVAVLNFNNMRDIENDAKTGKNTLAVKLGLKNAKIYQYLVVVTAFFVLIIFALVNNFELKQYTFLFLAPLFAQMMKKVIRINKPVEFDPFLKKTAIGTFLLSILFLIGILL